jgi:hypothetical protein
MPPDSSFGCRLESVETNQVDRGQRSLATFGGLDPERLQSQFDVLQHCQPRKQCERLEHHGNAIRRSLDGLAAAYGIA